MTSKTLISWVKRKQKRCRRRSGKRPEAKACHQGSTLITRKRLSELQSQGLFKRRDSGLSSKKYSAYYDTSGHQLGPIYVKAKGRRR